MHGLGCAPARWTRPLSLLDLCSVLRLFSAWWLVELQYRQAFVSFTFAAPTRFGRRWCDVCVLCGGGGGAAGGIRFKVTGITDYDRRERACQVSWFTV